MKTVKIEKYDVYSNGEVNTSTSRTLKLVFKDEQDGRMFMKYARLATGVIKVENVKE